MGHWSRVTVGVKNLADALSLWVDIFGMEIVAHEEGDDKGLNRIWNLPAGSISQQALLTTPNQTHGRVHLVEFTQPDAPVRENAQPTDFCPKNMDLYIDNMAAQLEPLKAAGLKFKNPNFTELTTPEGEKVREIHIHGHDQTNIVLLELVGKHIPFSQKGFAGVGPLVTSVADAKAEKAFYQNILSLDNLHDFLLDGPEIEKMIGLPPGAGLDMSVWGKIGEPMGQIEIIEYQGIAGKNLYPLAKPKSLGTLMVSYIADDLSALCDKLTDSGIKHQRFDQIETRLGVSSVVKLNSPGGMPIEFHQIAPAITT